MVQIVELTVPDGGWGWIVTLGAVFSNMLVQGFMRCATSLLLVEIRKKFNASFAEVAVIPALIFSLYMGSSPFASFLCTKYSCRFTAFFGAVLAVIGTIISGFVTNIYVLYFSLGIAYGMGAGLLFTAGFLIVGTYFDKKRGLSNGLCLTGNALGGVFMPFLVSYLLEEYGYAGAYLIMGGILFHCFILPLLYHPVEKHMVREVINTTDQPNGPFHTSLPTQETINLMPEKAMFISTALNSESDFTSSIQSSRENSFTSKDLDDYFADSAYNTIHENSTTDPHIKDRFLKNAVQGKTFNRVFQPLSEIWQSETISEMEASDDCKLQFAAGQSSGILPPGKQAKSHGRQANPNQQEEVKIVSKNRNRLTSLSSVAESLYSLKMSNAYLGSSINIIEEHAKGKVESIKRRHRMSTECMEEPEFIRDYILEDNMNVHDAKMKEDKKNFDWTILKNKKFLVILFSSISVTFGFSQFVNFLPSFVVFDLGLGVREANTLIAIISITGVIGAILSGSMRVATVHIIAPTMALSGLSIGCSVLLRDFIFIAIMCGFTGFLTGIHVALFPTMQGQELGPENVKYSYPIQLMVQGIVALISPIFCGVVLALTSDVYNVLFTIHGISLIFGGLVFYIFPLLK